VTLYKKTPLTGQTVELGLKNPGTYKLGAARISQSSLSPFKTGQGFALVQSGENAWTIYFEDGKAPALKDSKAKLKSSYVLNLELWAEGTYALDDGDKPVALTGPDGNAKTKPAIVKVKVNLK